MAKPYVYKLTHRDTGEYYIGYREANKKPARLDLGQEYFSSGKITKENFYQFRPEILQEFDTGDDAYDYEQSLIKNNRKDPLLLNKRYDSGEGLRFIFRGPHTDETKKKISSCGRGRRYTLSDSSKQKIQEAARKRPRPSQQTKNKIAQSRIGKTHSDETKKKIAKSAKGRPHRPISQETRNKMAVSQRMKWTDELRLAHSAILSNPSEDTRQKISAGNTGKKRSAEAKKKYSEAARKRSPELLNRMRAARIQAVKQKQQKQQKQPTLKGDE